MPTKKPNRFRPKLRLVVDNDRPKENILIKEFGMGLDEINYRAFLTLIETKDFKYGKNLIVRSIYKNNGKFFAHWIHKKKVFDRDGMPAWLINRTIYGKSGTETDMFLFELSAHAVLSIQLSKSDTHRELAYPLSLICTSCFRKNIDPAEVFWNLAEEKRYIRTRTGWMLLEITGTVPIVTSWFSNTKIKMDNPALYTKIQQWCKSKILVIHPKDFH